MIEIVLMPVERHDIDQVIRNGFALMNLGERKAMDRGQKILEEAGF